MEGDDGGAFHRPMRMLWMQELRGEVHELATTKSVRNLEREEGGKESNGELMAWGG